ncbi:hypothetical protein MIND_01202900 [Mycena indigotica]|uniref:Uncharacterized protein n=1 Tax=Mycena indigotica TaxID=2126181 RepID=A0A8H6S841_9AGAR|nr:uncharacterized protein MIND_01202900 [Mycena indigotica]KAF7293035.1 hypothetical protein MIND_01202900 [Mycena indigotica]
MTASELVTSLLADSLETFKQRGEQALNEARTRLEWSWGLEYRGLDEHLEQYPSYIELLTDERVIVIPHITDLRRLSYRNNRKRILARPKPISEIRSQTFAYFVLAMDPHSNVPPRRVDLDTPPHIVLIRAAARLIRAYGGRPRGNDSIGLELIERTRLATHEDPFYFGTAQLGILRDLYSSWTRMSYVSPSFKSGLSDYQTLVDDAPILPSPKRHQAYPIEHHPEPQRRVTASELQQAFNPPVEQLDDMEDSGSDTEDESNPGWANDLQQWAQVVLRAAEHDEKVLINHIVPDLREGSRTLTSVHLPTPDYLMRNRRHSVGP